MSTTASDNNTQIEDTPTVTPPTEVVWSSLERAEQLPQRSAHKRNQQDPAVSLIEDTVTRAHETKCSVRRSTRHNEDAPAQEDTESIPTDAAGVTPLAEPNE